MRLCLKLPSYRGLYLCSLLSIILLSVGIAVAASALLGVPIDLRGVSLGIAGSFLFAVVLAITGSMAFGVASGPVFGLPFGVLFGASFAVAFAVASRAGLALTGEVAFDLAGGVAFATAFGVALVMAVGVMSGMASGVALAVLLVALVGVAFGVAWIVVDSEGVDVAFTVTLVVAGIAAASRLLLYPFERLQARMLTASPCEQGQISARHPALWDELTLWPLPSTSRWVQACLSEDLEKGLQLALRIAVSSFQRCVVQRALFDFIAESPDALAIIYHLAYEPSLEEYLVPPCRRLQFQSFRPARLVLMGELGQRYVTSSSEATENVEYLVWRFTCHQRRMGPTALSQFCAMLYYLLLEESDLETTDPYDVQLDWRFGSAFEGIRPLDYGDEVAGSFATIAACLSARGMNDLASLHRQLNWIDGLEGPALRPAVLETLTALGDISREGELYLSATNTGLKSAALNRAAGEMHELEGYVQRAVLPPERVLLSRVVSLWHSIVSEEQGRLGQAALKEMAPAARRAAGIVQRNSAAWERPATPFDNPYIVGDPVYPPLLVGRQDLFDRIGEVWSAKKNPDSIIVYGHRRMGKSTILRNLDQVAPQGSVVVYADMAGETSFVASTSDLLLGLADRIYTSALRLYPGLETAEPDPEGYATQARAQFQFNRMLERVRQSLGDRILVLALDEFEAVERSVEEGKIGREIYQFLRAKTQEPWLALVFGGLHTLDEMSRDYQEPFYGSYENIRVTYLSNESAWRLITNPTDTFELNYEPSAIERIISETGGQPYLVQQICRDALDHLNHELFDLDLLRELRITCSDVESVLGDSFFQRGTVYFAGVWTQAGNRVQRLLLRTMAGQDEPWSFETLLTATGLSADRLTRELRWAVRHDIAYGPESGQWGFHVPLMRRWIRRRRKPVS
jgi:hypothetical protein